MSLVNRIVAGAGCLVIVGAGVFLGSQSTAQTERRTQALLDQKVDPQVAQERALARQHNAAGTTGYFAVKLKGDLEQHSLREIEVGELGQPNRFVHAVSEETAVDVGKPLTVEHLSLKITRPKISVTNRGMAVKRVHTIATLKNISDTPIAYRLDIDATADAECRGSRKHNAMGLLPGESADVIACAGKDSFVVRDLRVLEVTPIGYIYVSKIPPMAVGYGAEVGRAHASANIADPCSQVPAVKLAGSIERGDSRWEDVIDFFSRHNCERHAFPAGYRRTMAASSEFPLGAAGADAATAQEDAEPAPGKPQADDPVETGG